jgi:hypothetical protein
MVRINKLKLLLCLALSLMTIAIFAKKKKRKHHAIDSEKDLSKVWIRGFMVIFLLVGLIILIPIAAFLIRVIQDPLTPALVKDIYLLLKRKTFGNLSNSNVDTKEE